MNFTQTRELVRQCRRDHLALAQILEDLAAIEELPLRSCQLLMTWKGHQDNLARDLQAYLEDPASQAMLSTWYQFVPEMESLDGPLSTLGDFPDEEIIPSVMSDCDTIFLRRYRRLSEMAPNPSVAEFFAAIGRLELSESSAGSWAVAQFRDL
ncbi:MAG: hypothetical protein RL095_1716 [Verrucomicrobiota bacterium]